MYLSIHGSQNHKHARLDMVTALLVLRSASKNTRMDIAPWSAPDGIMTVN